MFTVKKFLSTLLIGAFVFAQVSVFGVRTADAAPASLRVLPIDRAKFLAGQAFDLRVEAANLSGQIKSFVVKVNGVDAQDYFGKFASRTAVLGNSAEYTIREAAFASEGSYEVWAKVETDAETLTGSVKYDVVKFPAGAGAKNVILFIGDGMSLPIRTAARIVSRGLTEGKYNGMLEMDTMDYYGAITTSGMDSLVTDSANSASAYATGHKSAVNAMGVYPDDTSNTLDDPRVENIIELVKRVRGMSTGLVTTSDITDATPAAMFGHTRRRSDSLALVDQMLEAPRRPDVIMGGGSKWFLPRSTPGSKRKDDREVISEFEKLGYTFVGNNDDLAKLDSKTDKIIGLFNLGNMNVYIDKKITRNSDVLGPFTDEPALWDMTRKAIDSLSQNPNGFFLMVEGASVDKQAHAMDWERTIWDTIEFDKAVGAAKRFAEKNKDTLIIVVADHSHGMSITGTYSENDGKKGREAVRVYDKAGYPTFTYNQGDGFPDQVNPDVTLAIGWGNHPDYREDYQFNPVPLSPAVKAGSKAVANPRRDATGEFFPGNIPSAISSEVHTADDVPISSSGPGSDYLNGVKDNTEVFHAMVRALGFDALKNRPADRGPKVIYNGRPVTLEYGVGPVVADGQVWLPMRAISEVVGGTVAWDGATRTATATRGNAVLKAALDQGQVFLDGQAVALGVRSINGRAYVPLELVGKAFGLKTNWDASTETAGISAN